MCVCILVTPCVGVWIETLAAFFVFILFVVTPCVGVWIETVMYDESSDGDLSHPAWVCGLKQKLGTYESLHFCHTLRGCVD